MLSQVIDAAILYKNLETTYIQITEIISSEYLARILSKFRVAFYKQKTILNWSNVYLSLERWALREASDSKHSKFRPHFGGVRLLRENSNPKKRSMWAEMYTNWSFIDIFTEFT